MTALSAFLGGLVGLTLGVPFGWWMRGYLVVPRRQVQKAGDYAVQAQMGRDHPFAPQRPAQPQQPPPGAPGYRTQDLGRYSRYDPYEDGPAR